MQNTENIFINVEWNKPGKIKWYDLFKSKYNNGFATFHMIIIL